MTISVLILFLADTDLRMFDIQEPINKLGMKLDGIARNKQPKKEVSYKRRKYSFNTKPVCYRCGRRGHIQYYCNYNQSMEGFRKERQVLHRATRPTYRQPEESSTYEEEENATNNPNLLKKMKPTRTSDHGRKPTNPNQKPRKLQTPNQSNVQLPLVNKAETYPSNLINKGKIAGKSVRLMLDTGAGVSAVKEELFKETYGDVSFSAVQTGKRQPTAKKNYLAVPLWIPGRAETCLWLHPWSRFPPSKTELWLTSITTPLL